MNGLTVVAGAIVIFIVAYITYGRWLVRTWGIDANALTPANKYADGQDYTPFSRFTVFAHQFTAIAGAGPVTGPIIGVMFGWGPALAWIVLGGIFFGAVHDFAALYASVKNKGKSIGMIIDQYIGYTGRRLFLLFVWLYTLLLMAAFADIIANTFSSLALEVGPNAPGAQAGTITILYIFLAMGFGLFIRKYRPSEPVKFLVAVALVIVTFTIGMNLPLYLDHSSWRVVIFGYCFIASILPMWFLIAPRDYLSAFLLIGMVLCAAIGIMVVNPSLNMPFFVGFQVDGKSLFPFLFITIACSAVSGFHSLVSSGTTSKTISSEGDMLGVSYGAMLLESLLGVVAVVIACAAASNGVMPEGTPFQIFASSVGSLFQLFGLSESVSACAIIMCLAGLAMTTIDSTARIGRMSFQEIFLPVEGQEPGIIAKLCMNRYFATILTLGLAYALCLAGYMNIWSLFGAANQLLAALVLITLAVFLKATGHKRWMLYIPIAFMFVVTMSALGINAYDLIMALEAGSFDWVTDGSQLFLVLALMLLAIPLVRQCHKEMVLQAIIIGSVLFTFIVGTVLTYYNMVYEEKYTNIVQEGEIDAHKTAIKLDKYLSANLYTVNFSAYMLDEMIKDNKSDAEMQEFLVEQSKAVNYLFPDNKTGCYGYINGHFFSGVGWKPSDDYVPTTRPWYKAAMNSQENTIELIPYIDTQTMRYMLAMSKKLQDGVNVIALDLPMLRLQELTDEAVNSGHSDFAAILDNRRVAVAFSEKRMLGQKNNSIIDEIRNTVVDKLETNETNLFEMNLEGTEYVIFAAEIHNGWYCISVRDASAAFAPLNRVFVLTMGVIILIAVVIIALMVQFNKRRLEAEKRGSQLASIADTYVLLYELDLIGDTYYAIKYREADGLEYAGHKATSAAVQSLGQRGRDCHRFLQRIVEEFTDESCQENMRDFVNFDKIEELFGEHDTIAMEFLTTEGNWRRARYVVSDRLADGRIAKIMFIVKDIVEEKRERERLVDLSERAIAASEAKSSFLSNMSHEIRTPINAVLGMNEMILRESDDKNIVAYSESIRTASLTLLGLVNDILDFSKIEAGKLEIIPVEYNISSVLNDLVNMVRVRADDKGLTLALDFDRDIPSILRGDDIRIKQVITNVLTNAVKYTEQGTVTFGVSYERISDDPKNVLLKVYVKDTGIGIKEEDVKKLFKEFERIEEKRNRNIEGTGLGLNITKSLLEMMGTSLQVESVYGQGSTFFFDIKQEVISWDPLGDYQIAYQETLENRHKYKEKFRAPQADILVVDDNPMNLMVFTSLLKSTSVKVDRAKSGDEGVSLTFDKIYDVIFLDHMMPGKDGIETLHEIRDNIDNPNISTPTICLTANAISGAREQYISEGFDDYLTKPIDSSKLEELLLKYLPADKIEVDIGDAVEDKKNEQELPPELEPLRGQTWINITTGLKNSGAVDAYVPLLKIFFDSMTETENEINGLYNEENWKDYTIKVHALKSSARIIGATDFGEEAQLLENAGKSGDIDYIQSHHRAFMDKYLSFREPLAQVFGAEESEPAKPEADAELMAEVYSEIKAAAMDRDEAILQSIFDEMQDYAIPEGDTELWQSLGEAVEGQDYERITELINSNVK